jgi:hypothetical protein
MKKFITLLPIILAAGCATPQETQCDPEKNYIISNPELIEEYKNEFKNGNIKNLYYDTRQLGSEKSILCNNSSCVKYDVKKFDFIEKKINDQLRNGVYTIYNHPKNDKRCNFWTQSWSKVCYESIKNENNEIKSKYGLYMYNENGATVSEFKKLNTNELIFKYSRTIYTNDAVGGPGFGTCPIMKNNNPNYKFNYGNFSSNPLNEPYRIE